MKPIAPDKLALIKESAGVCIGATQATLNTALAYDEASILQLDDLIERTWPDGPGEALKMAIQVWGSFLGEAMCCSTGATWVETEGGSGVAVGLCVAHPFAKMDKRFRNGMTDSVAFFYKVFKDRIREGGSEPAANSP